MRSLELTYETGEAPVALDMTADIAGFCADLGDGLLSVFAPHATAGVAIIETGAGSDVDLLDAIDQLLPAESGRWRHEHGTPGHGRDHVPPGFLSPSVTVPVSDGQMRLGTWQSLVLVDTNIDNPRRRVILSFLPG